MFKLTLLLIGSCVLYAADPFNTPAIKKAEDDCAKAEIAYRDALIAAWTTAAVKPYVLPDWLKDPKQSDMKKAQTLYEANQRINTMNLNFKRWSNKMEGITVAYAIDQMQSEIKLTVDAMARADKVMGNGK